MPNIKNTIENFLYPFIDKQTKVIAEGGEDTEIEGIRVLHEDSAFTHGALIHATIILYIHYAKKKDARADEIKDRLFKFIDITLKKTKVFTWGKLGILRGLNKLLRENMISVIDSTRLSKLKELTDYSDFLDKESVALINYPANYYQVALACAAYREKLGFENDGMSDKIEEKFLESTFSSGDDFMDDEPGYGRYDRYSLILTSEVSDLYRDIERVLPQNVCKNLQKCAKYCLDMANGVGDGFNYGRSLSVHGDLAPAEILSSAISRNLLNEKDCQLSLSYTSIILQKIIYFWYNAEKQSFNIWLDGRTTNDYRQIHRLLEVNMDMECHLYTLYDNIVAAGLEDVQIFAKIPYPEKWEYTKIEFADNYVSYILRYRDCLAMLPFIGTKVWGLVSAYNPFPAICGVIEGSPESKLPFLIPEYSDSDGNKYRPAHFINSTEEKEIDGGLMITAYGNL